MTVEAELSTRSRAETEIRAALDAALRAGQYRGEDVTACLDRVLDALAKPSEAVYQAAAKGIPMDMTPHGIHARCAALDCVRAHLDAVKAGL